MRPDLGCREDHCSNTVRGVGGGGAHLTPWNQVERGVWGPQGKVGGLLGALSPPHLCPPSEFASTQGGGRHGPGVTHIWRPAHPLCPPLLPPQSSLHCPPPYRPPSSRRPKPTLAREEWGVHRTVRQAHGAGRAGRPFPFLPNQGCCLRNQPQQPHVFLQRLPQTTVREAQPHCLCSVLPLQESQVFSA